MLRLKLFGNLCKYKRQKRINKIIEKKIVIKIASFITSVINRSDRGSAHVFFSHMFIFYFIIQSSLYFSLKLTCYNYSAPLNMWLQVLVVGAKLRFLALW